MPLTYGIVARCRNRASVDVGLSVRIGVTVSVPSFFFFYGIFLDL